MLCDNFKLIHVKDLFIACRYTGCNFTSQVYWTAGCMSPRKSGPNTAIQVGTQNIFSDVSVEGS